MGWQRRRKKKPQGPTPTPVQKDMQRVLDTLNAFGFLDDARQKAPDAILCFGPKDVFDGNWSGVVVWFRPRGYHGYKTLTVLGIWASAQMNTVSVVMGTHTLTFTAPFYNPEAYFHHIRRGFDLYYGDDVSPPDGPHQLYATDFVQSRRLEIRDAIETILAQYWPDS